MINNKKIAVIIPSYKVSNHIFRVIESVPSYVDEIYVVDDKCPENSGQKVYEFINDKRVNVIYNKKNIGVGGTTINGFLSAVKDDADILVKIDGDGQMNSKLIFDLVNPIVEKGYNYSKGNRFSHFNDISKMPKLRIFGNNVLGILVKISSGYWKVSDPTNGFIAVEANTFSKINHSKLAKRYFFESDMLSQLNLVNASVYELCHPSLYGDENSSLKIGKVAFSFPFLLFKRFLKRIYYKYFLFEINMGSIYLFFGLIFLLFGLIFGSYHWLKNASLNIETSTGTIMLSAISVILGFQLFIQFITFDIFNQPKTIKE